VALPEPPRADEKRPFPWVLLLAPMVVSVALALIMRQPHFLLFAALGPVSLLATQWTDRRQRRARAAGEQTEHTAQVQAAQAAAEVAADDEDAHLRRLWPDPATVLRIAALPRIELWGRRPDLVDWLNIRLGTADRPASVPVTGARPAHWRAPALSRAPVGVRLDEHPVVGLAGPPDRVAGALRWAVLQTAILHDPTEVRLAVVAPGAREDDLGWLRWLPHARDEAGNAVVAWTESDVDVLVKVLTETVAARTEVAGRSRAGAGSMPRIVVVLVGAAPLRRRPAVAELLATGPAAGLAFLCTEDDERGLPAECTAVLRRGDTGDLLTVAGAAPLALRADEVSADRADAAARALAPLRTVGRDAGARMPDRVRWVELSEVGDADAVRAGWRLRPADTAALVGADADGPVAIDLVKHGPHGLIAGTAGAGKSEFLQTLVAALAVGNTPEQLCFLFVDYKGGPTFKDLRRLPHVVATVTNLDQRAAVRAMSSLRAELERRQRQLADADAADVSTYERQRLADATLPAFPRLVIVIDEFAEMKDQLPDLLDDLVGVARTGRSLGVHLLLATQRPSGVVSPQIRANADLRVCLRVADDADSLDIIDTAAAARIPKDRPGRAYVQRAERAPQLMQSARITTPRCGLTLNRQVVPVLWSQPAPPAATPAAAQAGGTDLDAVLDAVVRAARTDGLTAPYPVLCAPLPATVLLDDLTTGPVERHRLVVGLRDLPARQRQETLTLDLGSGHLAVVGSARTGRTGAHRAFAVGLADAHRPDELHLHVLDGGGGLAALADLPHCGVYCGPDDGERVDRLLQRLAELVVGRRAQQSRLRAGSVAELWQRDPGTAPPQIVLLVDGWEAFGEPSGGPRQDRLIALLAAGLAAGVTVCLSGDESVLRARLLARIEHRLVLRLNNPADASLAGLPTRAMPAGLPPGRGLWAADGAEVQLPVLTAAPGGGAQVDAVAAAARRLRAAYPAVAASSRAPLRLDPLPVRITLAEAEKLGPAPVAEPAALLGVGGDSLAPIWLPSTERRVVVTGPQRCGRSTAAGAIATSLARQGAAVLFVAGRSMPGSELPGVRVVAAPGAVDALAAARYDAVVLDDADALGPDDPALRAVSAVDAATVVIVAGLDAITSALRGPLSTVRQTAGAVVLLSPGDRFAAAKLGVSLTADMTFTGPPGRAYVCVRGDVVLAQVPLPDGPG
jgi:S-DNA-T family DNA segregation ATPase FtsK/SpoIIIE